MNKQPGPITSREDETPLYIRYQYKGNFRTCGRYGYKGKDFWHKEGAKVPTCHYCDKYGHVKK